MSWFDTSGFASLAKTALKEAQKTIDKALDIKDEDQKSAGQSVGGSSDFFDTWGVKDEEDKQDKESTSQKQLSTSIWGSFTGSFFENPKDIKEDMTALAAKRAESFKGSAENIDRLQSSLVSSKSFPENLSDKTGSKGVSPNAIVQSPTDPDFISLTSKSESSEEFISEASSSENVSGKQSSLSKSQDPSSRTDDTSTSAKSSEDTRPSVAEASETSKKSNVVSRKKDQATSQSLNRLSILSAESDKKSSESVEVLSGTNTDCTNSPDSDLNSLSASVGPKVNSESVEVLPDSLVTSPSSVEILNDWKSDESPYMSPMDEKLFESSITPTPGDVMDSSITTLSMDGEDIKSSTSTLQDSQQPTTLLTRSDNLSSSRGSREMLSASTSSLAAQSPESVEVITDVDDVDEVSLADDSYTSASESTTLLTIMETLQQQQQQQDAAGKQMHDSCPDSRQIMSTSAEYPLTLSLDSLKEKQTLASLHLPIEAITKQPIRKQSSELSKSLESPYESRLKPATIEPPRQSDSSGGSDQYLMLTDSSCEETLVESSSEENASTTTTTGTIMMTKQEQQQGQQQLTTSSYVKHMLADAMADKGETPEPERHEMPRENSPISSESRSDLVKIGSDQTSGHTSGDELETTTSSDIEIISRYSPNGDSSSTQSRQSPAKLHSCKSSDLLTKTLKTRGHSRELSEISVGSDDASPEVERLLRRIREMTEILEARESKLIDVSRANMDLHEQNASLKKQLDNVEKHVEHSQDITQITDEYTQRLSALERKFQQAIRERDSLRKSLEQVRQEATARLANAETNAEKDVIISELREEGEKLSKQQLQHSNIIKKLRAKDKENEALIKSQKEQIEEQNTELERLKRSLYAKEEVERSQIDAVHTLTAKCKKQEKEILSLHEQLDHVKNKMDAYKKSFDAAKAELLETKDRLTDAEEELTLATENAGESHQRLAQVQDLKIKLRQAEEARVKKEQLLKQENMELLKRLEASESRTEEMSESVSQATKPLLRQLEQLQSSLSHKTSLFMRQEESMTEKIADLQTKVDSLSESNRSFAEESTKLKSRCSVLEGKLHAKENEKKKLEELVKSLREETKKLVEEIQVHQQAMKMLEEAHATEVKELKREITSLEHKVLIEKAAMEAEKRKNSAVLEQQPSVDEELRYSPTLSIERDSVSSANSIWPAFNDTVYESGSGRFPNVYDSFRSGTNSTSMIENLQSQLKQRDGEVQQLQWELSRRNAERDALNSEVSSLASRVEDLTSTVAEMDTIKESLNDIQTKYDALLQMYGEKVEENQELRLDLEDVKEMYKTQIDQLLKRDL